jgi:hypothetical protein
MNKNQGATQAIILTVGTLAVAAITANVAFAIMNSTLAVTIAELVGIEIAAAPIALIVGAIVLLGVALVVAYKKSKTFQNIVNGAFNAIKAVAIPVFHAIADASSEAWSILKSAANKAWNVIGPIVRLYASYLGHIKDGLTWLKNHAGEAWGAVKQGINSISGVISTVLGPLKSALDRIITAMQWIISHLPSIPSLSSVLGGHSASAGSSGGGGVGFGGHPNPTKNPPGVGSVIVQIDGRTVAHAVANYDKTYRRQNGRSLFST